MYEKRNRQEKQRQLHMLSIDDLVPKNYILRDIDKAIDFSFIYDEVEGIYRCSFVRQKNEKRRELKYLPDPEPLGASPKTPCKRMFFRIAQFIASQRGESYLYSECNAFGIYRSDAYAAATF